MHKKNVSPKEKPVGEDAILQWGKVYRLSPNQFYCRLPAAVLAILRFSQRQKKVGSWRLAPRGESVR